MRVDGMDAVPVVPQPQLIDDVGVEEPDRIRTRAHHVALVRKRSLQGARAAEPLTRLQDEHAQTRARQVCGTRQPVVARTDDDRTPAPAGIDRRHDD